MDLSHFVGVLRMYMIITLSSFSEVMDQLIMYIFLRLLFFVLVFCSTASKLIGEFFYDTMLHFILHFRTIFLHGIHFIYFTRGDITTSLVCMYVVFQFYHWFDRICAQMNAKTFAISIEIVEHVCFPLYFVFLHCINEASKYSIHISMLFI